MRKPQWAVHAEVLIKMFHPKLAKSEMWHCVSHGKMFQSRERGPWEGSSRGYWGQCVCVVLAACVVLPTGAVQEAVSPEMTSLTETAFRWFTVEMPLDPGGTAWQGFGLCTLKTEALSLRGISDKLVLRQSLQKCVLFINWWNVWGFLP